MNPLPAADPSIAITYVRVSSAEQADQTGPERQRRNLRAFAAREGLQIVAEHSEDISGTLPLEQRPELAAALVSAQARGAGVLLVDERTRLARDEYAAHDAIRTFAAAGIRVLYADGSNGAGSDDNSAHLLDSIGHAVAAYERRVIVARLAAGRQIKAAEQPHARKQGGRVPLGYRRTRNGVEIDPGGAAEVQRVFELVRLGATIRQTADQMGAETGRHWMPTTVARIVKRADYTRSVGSEKPLVSLSSFKRTQTALAERRRSQPRNS